MRAMSSQLLIPTALAALMLAGCTAAIYAVGISPDKVDQIELGSTRQDVEDLVNSVEQEESCAAGSRVFYVYDRGQPPGDRPGVGAVFLAAYSAINVGVLEILTACQFTCQRGLLEVVYDRRDRVVAVYPHPDGYDVGDWCGARSREVAIGQPVPLSGRTGSHCLGWRSDAWETDRARAIGDSKDIIAAVGCD